MYMPVGIKHTCVSGSIWLASSGHSISSGCQPRLKPRLTAAAHITAIRIRATCSAVIAIYAGEKLSNPGHSISTEREKYFQMVIQI